MKMKTTARRSATATAAPVLVLTCLSAALVVALTAPPATVSRAAESDAEGEQENLFAGGAPLKTDPELESQMRRAAKFAEDGEYGYAATVWQYVLDKSGDTLMTNDGRTYISLAEEVERTLTKLPPEGLRVYRITADGEAKAILAQAENEEDALSEVVRRYFISSSGDDAAYKLGCLALDRYDFVGASRLFTKVLELHPDPSVPKSDLLLRLAVASARVGDQQSANNYTAEAQETLGPGGEEDLVAAVRQDVARVSRETNETAAGGEWRMALGGPHRRGHMASLPATVMSSTLTELWGFTFPVDFSTEMAGDIYAGGMIEYSGRTRVQPTQQGGQQPMLRWRSQPWRSAGQILFADGLAMFKTNNDLTAWKRSDIGVQAEGEQSPYWRTAWLNSFQLDAATQMYIAMGMQQQLNNRPVQPSEVMLFGDRIHHDMSVADGVVYNLEGPRAPRYGSTSVAPTQQQQRGYQYGMVPRRSRKNWLAAYEARSGKALWYRSPSDADEENGAELGFLAAPVPYGNLLLAPVSDGGAIWMYALSRDDGATVWKSYLCDEPSGGCSPWSPACVAIDGRDAYVVCGTGVVFALDAVSGQIRFAVRYARHGKPSQIARNYGYGNNSLMELNGWDEDVLVPYGRALVVMATDHDRLLAIDRRTGEMLWDSPRKPFSQAGEYCLGTVGRSYFVAGRNVVRRYDIPTGLVKWEVEIEDSFGRGALTEDGLFVPVRNSIWQLDLESGEVMKKVGVSLSTDDPVGNLYSDGERFWVLGGNRIYVLTNLEHRLSLLEKRISQGDPAALLDRMRLWAKSDEMPKALADLETAHGLVLEKQGRPAAAAALLGAISEIHLVDTQPSEVLRLLQKHLVDLGPDAASDNAASDAVANLVNGRRDLLRQTLWKVRENKAAGAVDGILALAALYDDEAVQRMARQALAAAAVADDEALLSAALRGDDVMRQLIAVDALTRLSGADLKPELQRLLAKDDARLQLAAARSLANLGDREAFPPLLRLMRSDDVSLRSQAAHILRRFTGQQFGYTSYEEADKREAALVKWSEWLDGEGKTAKLTFPLPESPPLLGRTLVASYAQNFVREYDSSGKQVWNQQTPNPWCCQGLPNGHRLISLYAQNAVVEYDEKGAEIWRTKGSLPGNPFSVQRLDNGNTLIACSDSSQVVEVAHDGGVVWSAKVENRPMDAKRLENGNTLVCCGNGNRVIEINRAGEEVWKLENMNGPIKAQRLENGNTLVVQMNSGQVVEVDRGGKQVWQKNGLQQPYDAQRLPNGNTLIVDNQGVHEFAPGKDQAVWEERFNNGSGVSRF